MKKLLMQALEELSGEIVIIGREMHPDGTTCDKFAKLLLFKTCANQTYKYKLK